METSDGNLQSCLDALHCLCMYLAGLQHFNSKHDGEIVVQLSKGMGRKGVM